MLRIRSALGGCPREARPSGEPGFSGINTTTLTWDANTEPNLARYEVVTRETTSPDWTDAIGVGNVTTVTLDIAKDNRTRDAMLRALALLAPESLGALRGRRLEADDFDRLAIGAQAAPVTARAG